MLDRAGGRWGDGATVLIAAGDNPDRLRNEAAFGTATVTDGGGSVREGGVGWLGGWGDEVELRTAATDAGESMLDGGFPMYANNCWGSVAGGLVGGGGVG
ncbi:hypothetical protein [Rhizocola hellebori]|nr:hypothetical protein [Rhizocola hellebori]